MKKIKGPIKGLVQDVTFQNKDLLLGGTLTIPDTKGLSPVVIVAHTSAAGRRDYSVYQHLTRTLSACGVATFVCDRRGSGKSTGDFATASFSDLASDMQAAVNALKCRDDIDPKKIGLWGMSQGGWIAPLTASESADVAFVIAVSAVGVSPAEQMNYSAEFALREGGYSEPVILQMLELRRQVDEYYRGHAARKDVQKNLDKFQHEAWFPSAYIEDSLPEDPTIGKWQRILDFDPLPVMRNINVPVLLLYGERDPWVPIAESIRLWQKYSPKEVSIYQIKDANHFMVSIASSGIRGDQGPFVKEYESRLTQWLRQQTG